MSEIKPDIIYTIKLMGNSVYEHRVKLNLLISKLQNLQRFLNNLIKTKTLSTLIQKNDQLNKEDFIPYVVALQKGCAEVCCEFMGVEIKPKEKELGEYIDSTKRPGLEQVYDKIADETVQIFNDINNYKKLDSYTDLIKTNCLKNLKEVCSSSKTATGVSLFIDRKNKRLLSQDMNNEFREKINDMIKTISRSNKDLFFIYQGYHAISNEKENEKELTDFNINLDSNDVPVMKAKTLSDDTKIEISFIRTGGKSVKLAREYRDIKKIESEIQLFYIVQILGDYQWSPEKKEGTIDNYRGINWICPSRYFEMVQKYYEDQVDTILALEDDWDGYGSTDYDNRIVEETQIFIAKIIFELDRKGFKIPFPDMLGGSNGGIDLELTFDKFKMDIEIPVGNNLVEVTAWDDKGNGIQRYIYKFETNKDSKELIDWIGERMK